MLTYPHPPSAGPSPVDVICVLLNGCRLGFLLPDVREVLPAMESTPLPHAPGVVHGLAIVRGEPLPVLDLRARLGMSTRPLHPDDHVVVCRVGGRDVGVWVDRADDIVSVDAGDIASLPATAPNRHVKGAVMLDDGLLLVTDVESFLDVNEAVQLEAALSEFKCGVRE